MPLNRAMIGRSFPADGQFEVSRELIRRFADAIGDPNPAYRDAAAARALGHADVIAPPTFMTCVQCTFAAANPVFGPELGADYGQIVHGEQRYVIHRPAHPGDVVVQSTTITDIRDAGANEVMTMELDYRTTDGELVCTAYNTVVSRGTAGSR